MDRTDRIAEEIKKELSYMIQNELKDPRITGLISVTKALVTKDLKYCKVYVSIFSDDKSLNSFILSSLILINLVEETNYAKRFSKLTSVLNIRSFVFFKLHKLIEVWEKEIVYYNSTFSGEYKDGLYLEFLRFIAQNSHNKIDIAYLEDNSREMLLLDKSKKTIRVLSKGDEIGIIVCLVMYAPKKLIINCLDSLSRKVANLISYIFEDRVSILL